AGYSGAGYSEAGYSGRATPRRATPGRATPRRATPGRCKFKDIRRNLQRDVGELQNQGVEDVFVFCTRGELHKYRVPRLLEAYRLQGLRVHHLPFPDGGTPDLEHCCQILEALQANLHNNRKTVIHCYGGLGRSGLIAACLLLKLSVSMTPDKAIEILREHRGGGAIQTFREKYSAYQESKAVSTERSVSR
ncbi:unnamed protein product, partial [Coregonus sp. 'balchen']